MTMGLIRYSFGVTVVVLLSFHIGRTYSGDIRPTVWPCAASVLPMCAPQHASIATMQVGAEKATTVFRRVRRHTTTLAFFERIDSRRMFKS